MLLGDIMVLCTTERLLIRTYEDSDADSVFRVAGTDGIYRTTYAIPRDYTKRRAHWWIKYIRSTAKNHTGYEFGMFIRGTNEYVGNIGVVNINTLHNRGEITYFVDPELWGRGFATEGGRAMLQFAFLNLKLKRLGGSCMSCNRASRRVMEKLGFMFEGTSRCELLKDGFYYDIDRLSILDSEFFSGFNSTFNSTVKS